MTAPGVEPSAGQEARPSAEPKADPSAEAVAGSSTIVALSSPAGPAARAVLRASGPDAAALLGACLRWPRGPAASAADPVRTGAFLAARGAAVARVYDGVGTVPALVLWMPGPASYTREDVFELHVPGAPPLVEALLTRLAELGARPAARGEFTRRAFLNGRLDLTRAEGVLELVSASSEAEARAAGELLEGGLERRVTALREGLEGLRALMEASLDFDESDTGHVPLEELRALLSTLRERLGAALGWEVRRQPPSTLPRVVLVGPPNAGKSTLFNALVGREGALVSPHAGTTRDLVTGLWDLGPAAVLLVDTAGEEEAVEGVAAEAQARMRRALGEADLVLRILPPGAEPGAGADEPQPGDGAVHRTVWSQGDRRAPEALARAASLGPAAPVVVAAPTGAGLERLRSVVASDLGIELPAEPGAAPGQEGAREGTGGVLFARHRGALEEARRGLESAAEALEQGAPLDLVAEALRAATAALDSIQGRTTPEDLLDRIFARFCLGK